MMQCPNHQLAGLVINGNEMHGTTTEKYSETRYVCNQFVLSLVP